MRSLILFLHKKLLVMPWAALVVFGVAVGSLFTAYVAETFFGIAPCTLCLYQRIPYALAAFLSIAALAVWRSEGRARCLLGICAVVFLINAGIAFFHSGVELHWWKGTDGCAVDPVLLKNAGDIEALRKAIMEKPAVRCDEINFTFLGFTMANWNVVASLGMMLFSFLASLGPCITWARCEMKDKEDA